MKSFFLLLFTAVPFVLPAQKTKTFTRSHGAVVRGDSTKKEISLVFTADEFGEGLPSVLQTLKKENVKAGFFFTGHFYRNPSFYKSIQQAKSEGHYLGPHSDQHLLYCDWAKRDSLLVTRDSFTTDMVQNIKAMKSAGIAHSNGLFIPPFEWWNDSIAAWSKSMDLRLFNFTPGIRTAADYTWPETGTTYKSSEWITTWLKEFAVKNPTGLNGAVLLLHAGADPRRTDKLYNRLAELIDYLKAKGYRFKRIDGLLR